MNFSFLYLTDLSALSSRERLLSLTSANPLAFVLDTTAFQSSGVCRVGCASFPFPYHSFNGSHRPTVPPRALTPFASEMGLADLSHLAVFAYISVFLLTTPLVPLVLLYSYPIMLIMVSVALLLFLMSLLPMLECKCCPNRDVYLFCSLIFPETACDIVGSQYVTVK